MNETIDELKLVALDRDDIAVVSAHVQDALVRVADIFWQPREHRFVMGLNRFDWMSAADTKAPGSGKPDYRRCRSTAAAKKTCDLAFHWHPFAAARRG